MGYYFLPKKRAIVYANLKTAFSKDKSPLQLETLTRLIFMNLSQSFFEFLCLAKIHKLGFKDYVQLKGREHIEAGILKGKGVILLAMHSGNWELGNVINGTMGHVYHAVANHQSKSPEFDALLNQFRRIGGGKVITAGSETKDIIGALKRNEIVGLLLDQGGKEGIPIDFFGKTASMSTGAVRLALKYGCTVCPVWMTRQPNGSHLMNILPALELKKTGNIEDDVKANTQCLIDSYEKLLKDHPQEYFWFYKVFKYTTDAHVLILDDGNAVHLKRSQTAAHELASGLEKNGKKVTEKIISLKFKNPTSSKLLGLIAKFFPSFCSEGMLKYFLTGPCYSQLMSLKADFVISCGADGKDVNRVISKDHQAKSIELN